MEIAFRHHINMYILIVAIHRGGSHKTMSTIPIDPTLLDDLESRALEISANLDNVLSHLQTQMFEFSHATLDSISVYKLTADNLTATVDDCTKRTLELITQCDELDKDFAPLYTLAAQIKSIKQTVDVLQQALR